MRQKRPKTQEAMEVTVQISMPNRCQTISKIFPIRTQNSKVKETLDQILETESIKGCVGYATRNGDLLFDYQLSIGYGYLQQNQHLECVMAKDKFGLDQYEIKQCLATGGFSKVYLVRSQQNGLFYAAKFISKNGLEPSQLRLIQSQKEVNSLVKSAFTVEMVYYEETDNFFVFVMEYCPGGELFFLLRQVKRMDQLSARFYFLEILLGLAKLHKDGIVYRDLKPQNILIAADGHTKIADFGLAKVLKERSYSYCGSIEYMCPEIVACRSHGFQVDFYCIGALLFQLLVGCPPFYEPNSPQELTKLKILQKQVQFPASLGLSEQVKQLITALLEKDPNKRLGRHGGVREIWIHPWIGRVSMKSVEQKLLEPPYFPNLSVLNFDLNDIGESADRFTQKIRQEYRLYIARRSESSQGKPNSKAYNKKSSLNQSHFKLKQKPSKSIQRSGSTAQARRVQTQEKMIGSVDKRDYVSKGLLLKNKSVEKKLVKSYSNTTLNLRYSFKVMSNHVASSPYLAAIRRNKFVSPSRPQPQAQWLQTTNITNFKKVKTQADQSKRILRKVFKKNKQARTFKADMD